MDKGALSSVLGEVGSLSVTGEELPATCRKGRSLSRGAQVEATVLSSQELFLIGRGSSGAGVEGGAHCRAWGSSTTWGVWRAAGSVDVVQYGEVAQVGTVGRSRGGAQPAAVRDDIEKVKEMRWGSQNLVAHPPRVLKLRRLVNDEGERRAGSSGDL